jgi:hypothetical protein
MNSSAVQEWNTRGVLLWLDGGQIKFRGRWDVITDEVLEELRDQKPALTEELKALEAVKVERKAFAQLMERLWIGQSRPQWWDILRDALGAEDMKRAQYAWNMLTEVLKEDS